MATIPVTLFSYSLNAILGPDAKGHIRGWVDGSGEIRVTSTTGMDAADKPRIAIELMKLIENGGGNPKGVAFL